MSQPFAVDANARRAESELYNDDLAPTGAAQRTWHWYHFAALWVGMVMNIASYMLAAGLTEQGMSPWQSVITVLLGNLIVLVPMLLIGHAGTRYGIPYAVLVRASFGTQGAKLPAMLRAVVACGWYGIQSWLGGSAIYTLVNILTHNALVGDALPFLGISIGQASCFLIFWVFAAVLHPARHRFDPLAGKLVRAHQGRDVRGARVVGLFEGRRRRLDAFAIVTVRCWRQKGGPLLGDVLAEPHGHGGFLGHARAQHSRLHALRKNAKGPARGSGDWPAHSDGVALGGLRGGDFGNGRDLRKSDLGPDRPHESHGGRRRGIALVILTLDTMCCNLAANLVGPAYDFSSLWPKGISYKAGGLITAAIAIGMMPWKILATTQGYIFTWLVGYSALLGPVAGILIVDYFLVRRTRLDTAQLFEEDGEYAYSNGWNPAAVIALLAGVLPNLPGFLNIAFPNAFPGVPDAFKSIYTYAWFVGLAIAAVVYGALMKLGKSRRATVASA
ncbi:NCS1 family nucleobase:cation symporter-1 [Paraburkholderia youngii]